MTTKPFVGGASAGVVADDSDESDDGCTVSLGPAAPVLAELPPAAE